ncbi:MAG: cadherin-like domain-containing protein [Bryobacterales bacterium]|nr:cadherin-like domain-containing protein [Bryobacterales bacterium]
MHRLRTCVLLFAFFALSALVAGAAPLEVSTVPADASDPALAHSILSGRATTLKATSSVGGADIEAFWEFGDGTPGARFTLSDPNDASIRHVYSAAPGSRFVAKLTVTNKSSGDSASALYPVVVAEPGLAVEARIAVSEGLWYLHRNLNRSAGSGSWRGDCAACDANGASTATNILAFERAGFDESGDAANPYTRTVALARRWLAENADNPSLQSPDLEQSLAKAGTLARAATIELSLDAARTLLDTQNASGFWTASGAESPLATGRAIRALATSVRAAASTIFNVSPQVAVTSTGFLYSRVTRTYNGTLTVTNTSGTVIPGPINVVFTNLPGTVTLANANGTWNGSPYRTAAGGLNPGQSLQLALSFNNPNNVAITSTPVTYSGTFPPAPVTLGCPANTGTNGTAYNSALNGEGGVQAYTFSISSGSLPNGIILNPATGAIAGNPTANGTFPFTATLVDGTGLPSGTATANCSITIAPPAAPLSLTCPTNTGQVGVPYSSAFLASGGAGGYTFSLSGGALPTPLVLTPGTGAVAGTPSASGPFNFTGLVTDANLQTQTASCSINISPASTVAITVTTVPAGLSIVVDGNTLTAPQTFNWTPGSNHTIATTSPQGSGGTRQVFNNWSDGGPISHSITTPGSATTFTATFDTEHQLTTAVSPSGGGTVTPASGTFFPANSVQNVSATANSGFTFQNWTGPVANSSNAATTVTMSGPVSITANFTATNVITVTTVPAGLSIIVDGNTLTAPQTFNWTPGSNHTIGTTTPQGSGGTRHVFSTWSDGGAIVHSIVAPGSATTFTANFNTEHQLTIAPSPANGGNVTPASGTFFPENSVQNITATATSGFTFSNWTGPVANANAAATMVTMSAPVSVTANFTAQVGVTVQTSPPGLSIIVDGNTLTAPQTFNWTPGSNHTLATTSPQGSGGTRFVFNNWSDGGAISHTITAPGSAATFTATFDTEHQLTTAVAPAGGGTVTPASGSFFPANSVQNVSATANSGFSFSNWTGPVANTNASATTVTMSAPVSITANFSANISVVVQTSPTGLSIVVDGNTLTAPQTFSWVPGSNHTIATTSPQGSGGTRFVFSNWSDAGAISHSVAPNAAITYTATFTTEHQLTTAANGDGTVTPASGSFFPAGSVQPVSATANSGFAFNGWTGPVANALSAATTVTMNAPASVTANFVTALSATCPSATQGNIGTAYSSGVTATGGTAGYSYSLASGTLPPPLTLAPGTGVISGTPTTKGTYNFGILVQDSTSPIQQSTTVNCSILIPNRLPTANTRFVSLSEDSPATFPVSGTDPDGDSLSFTLVTPPTKGNVTGFGAGTCSGTPSNCTRSVTYTPSANLNGSDSFTFLVNDGEGNSTTATVSLTITAVNDAPVLTAKNFTVQANMRIVLGAGTMLAGATDPGDPENTTPSFTLSSMTPVSGTVTASPDGSFVYDPPSGTIGNVNFTYTVCDNGVGAPASSCTGGAGTFAIAGPVIHFVNPAAATNGDGRLQTPFNSLSSATAAMGGNTNHRIFVYTGTTASGAGVTLPTDGWLVGQGVTGTSFDDVMGISPPVSTIARPSINGTHPIIQGTVSMNGNNVNVRGLRIQPPASSVGLQATLTGPFTGQVVGNIPNVTTSNARAINLNNVSGTYSITAVNASGSFDVGINLSNVNPSSGSFSVTGTGSTNSGGTIGSATGDGIRLATTRGVSLTDMLVQNSVDNNLDARNVNGLTINRSTFDTTTGAVPVSPDLTERHNFYGLNVRDLNVSNGTIFDGGATNAVNIHNVKIDNLLGTSIIDNSIIRDGKDMNLAISNSTATSYAGTADTLTIRNNTRIQTPSPGSGAPGDQVQIFSQAGGNLSVTITGGGSGNTQITGASQNCVQLVAQGVNPSPGKLTSSITNATMTGNNGPCINLATANNGVLTATVDGLTLSSAASSPVNISNQGDSIINATISNNTITVPATGGNGVTAEVENDGTLNARVNNNNISGNGTYGIRGQSKTNGGVLNLTANNNTIALTNLSSLEGIAVEAGSSAGASTAAVCLNMFSNNSASNTGGQEGYRLSVRSGTTFQLQNFVGSGTSTADVQTWISSTKSNTGSSQISIFTSPSQATFSTTSSCPTP